MDAPMQLIQKLSASGRISICVRMEPSAFCTFTSVSPSARALARSRGLPSAL